MTFLSHWRVFNLKMNENRSFSPYIQDNSLTFWSKRDFSKEALLSKFYRSFENALRIILELFQKLNTIILEPHYIKQIFWDFC